MPAGFKHVFVSSYFLFVLSCYFLDATSGQPSLQHNNQQGKDADQEQKQNVANLQENLENEQSSSNTMPKTPSHFSSSTENTDEKTYVKSFDTTKELSSDKSGAQEGSKKDESIAQEALPSTSEKVNSIQNKEETTQNLEEENQDIDKVESPDVTSRTVYVDSDHGTKSENIEDVRHVKHGDGVPPDHTTQAPVELTQEEREELMKKVKQENLFHEGMKMINSSNVRSSVLKGYQMLGEAAELGHADAAVEIGFAYFAGAYFKQNIDFARETFMKYATGGNPRAQTGLGIMYATGIGLNSSQAKALVYLTFAALGDDVMARMILGYRYLSGIGVARSCETSLNYYRTVAAKVAAGIKLTGGSILMRVRLLDEAEKPGSNYGMIDDDLVQYYQFLADKGDAPAQVTLGQLNYQGTQGFDRNVDKAFEYFSKAAESGNGNAQGYLGKIYAEGSESVKPNNETALKYFKRSADQGNPVGQAGLGLMYLYGKGVAVSHEKAFKNFQMSADQGWPEGQLHLGNMYFHGQGVKRDFKQALRCFNLAAQNGHLLALYNLAKMHATGTGVMRSCQTAVELLKNVCERGRWSSHFELAYMQYKGGKVDSSLGIYMLLAELGYEVAQSNVAYILDQEQSNIFTNQTFARALVQWDRAAEQGYAVARIKLGDYHYYGKGTEVDYEIAASHYKIATEQNGNAQAMFNLGYMHEKGLGMKKDIHLAKRHYDMAAETSADAFVPVCLALIKVGFLFAIDFLQNQRWFHSLSWSKFSSHFPEDWDLYVITFLCLLLGFIFAYRRQRR